MAISTTTVCDTGYYGPNCSLSCRYPNYGVDCQNECKCVQDLCNHISGCDYDRGDHGSSVDILIVALTVGGIFIIIGAFVVISIANRKFFTRYVRKNAHYVASVVAEESDNTYNSLAHHRTACPSNVTMGTDNGIYALANTMRYETINAQ
ncbi:uncharacterized protein LOC125675318 [Ostrea edulis]|uniref:uncharacterized protein LOC125675318 n=1 Tax=Ostrea edulis TaxID=37623 RepID=UPI0024AF0553|nr:uncharacterized protein LOC125675318 [Ostrea edulis]